MIDTPPLIGATDDPVTDPAAFARDVLRTPAHEYEVPALRCSAPNVVIVGGRRSGKTWTAQVRALHSCMTRAGSRWIVTAPNRDKVRLHLAECAELLRGVPAAAGSVLDEQRDRITFANGSELLGLPPTPGQLRGYGRGVLGLTLDEAGFIASQVWRDAAWTLLENRAHGAQAFLISTPWGPADHPLRRAFDLGTGGDPDHAAFRWPSTLNPAVSAEWVEAERERIAPSEFAAEVLGEWSDAVGAMFPRELLDAHTADVELPGLLDVPSPLRLPVGLDTGVSFDRSAAAAWARLPVAALNPDREPLPVFVPLVHVWPVRTPVLEPAREVAARIERWTITTVETNGVGAGVYQHLRELVHARPRSTGQPAWGFRWNPHATSAASKAAGYGVLLALMERGQIVLPRHPDLLRQLAGLRFEQGERGMVRIGAEDAATHDDAADAVWLAAGPFRPQGAKTVRVALQGWAGARAPREAVAGGRDGEVIETRAGLRLWRRSPLQSPAGPEVADAPAEPAGPVENTERRTLLGALLDPEQRSLTWRL